MRTVPTIVPVAPFHCKHKAAYAGTICHGHEVFTLFLIFHYGTHAIQYGLFVKDCKYLDGRR
ncbi:MAG: hypothetical protein Q4B58_05535 [Bacteroidales bacterium]|nr:hypothetical protein [Bacteroidales bacterium]